MMVLITAMRKPKLPLIWQKKLLKIEKKEKNDGDRGLSSSHLIAASDKYYEDLSKLFVRSSDHCNFHCLATFDNKWTISFL